ncbi:EF-hand domain-containing protein [Sphingomonas silueang]|uniref:EF-hand domain-containing protein n=1 Tax=Sphingomonas silueang TaxID=3156617 RepID=UPI0032B5B7C8
MRSFLLAASVAALALPAVAPAQQAAPRPMADDVLTRAEALARADRRFDRIDADHDGRITAAELAAIPARRGMAPQNGADAQARSPGEGRGGRGMGARMLKRADTNNDGVVTREEYRAQAAAAFDRQDANKDGKVDATERQQWREQRGGRRGGGMARIDARRDGVVTRAEYQARALARFDRLDLNKDGRIDATERGQHRQQRAERRAQG